ncbi:MAG: hypothetical protein AAF456_14170 [Planctomycetota bacterium]
MTRSARQINTPTVLLLGNRRQSLTVIRSLAKDGWKIIAAVNKGDDRNYHAHRSRYVSGVWEHDDYRDHPFLFGKQLTEFLDQHPNVTTVFPVDEASIRTVHKMRDELAQRVTLVLANEEAISTCLNKSKMLELCRLAGVKIEPFREINNVAALGEACEEVGYPCVIKPLDEETIWFGTKVAIVNDHKELEATTVRLKGSTRRLLVQRLATGPRHNVYFAARDGEVIGSVEVRIERTDRSDGTGLAVTGQTIRPRPALLHDTKTIVEALGYSGVGCAQFIVCPETNRRCFLEMNPRLGANFAVVHYAGLALASLAERIAAGELVHVSRDYIEGYRFAWTYGELAGLRFEIRNSTIPMLSAASRMARCILSALSCHRHITWLWGDPLPTLLEFRRGLFSKSKSSPPNT